VDFTLAGLSFDASLILRVICGGFLLPHTVAKLSNIERASLFFDKVGLRPPRFFVVFTATMELVAAFGLVSGFYPRLAALIGAAVLMVAAWAVARTHGFNWRWQHPGVEYMIFWALIFLYAGFLA
jgi:putative oxidoreductase